MINEYVLLPCIFDPNRFDFDNEKTNKRICRFHFKNLLRTLLDEGAIVRDLCDGKWSQCFIKPPAKDPDAKRYFLKKLKKEKRLFAAPATQNSSPESYIDWAREALSSHKQDAVSGIIASPLTQKKLIDEGTIASGDKSVIAPIEELDETNWWKNRFSFGVQRTTNDYLKHLNLILYRAKSIMFIDPYFDPLKPEYQAFNLILQKLKRPQGKIRIEVHLFCDFKDGTEQVYQDSYYRELGQVIKQYQLKVKFFLWKGKFHDRYIISNLVGIMSGHSFSIGEQETTWTRLDGTRTTDIGNEFAESSKKYGKPFTFTIS